MAFDATDIQRLKAAIPTSYQPPRGAGGMLSSQFDSSVDLRSKSTAMHGSEIDRHNLGLAALANPDAIVPGIMLTGAHATARAVQRERHEREQRKDAEFTYDQVRQELQRRLAKFDAELAAIERRLKEISERREKIGDEMEALDELAKLKGKFDPNNPAHARLARRAGITPEEAAQADGAAILRRRQELAREDSGLDDEWNAKIKRRDVVLKERKPVADALAEIERADTEEALILAERRATTTLGAQQLGEAAYQTRRQDAKFLAADAVAQAEREPLRTDSQIWNRQAVESVDKVITGSVDEFDFDDAPPSAGRSTSLIRPAP